MLLSFLAFSLAFSASPQASLEAGMEAQRAGRTDEAIGHYTSCITAVPEHVKCHWELGWSYWQQSDWEAVVEQWKAVERLDPHHPKVGTYLPKAQGHLESMLRIRASAAAAPATARAPVPQGKTLHLRAVGDIMMGTDFPGEGSYLPPERGERSLAGVYELLRGADLTFGNLEGPLCDGGSTHKCGSSGNCYAFRTPTSYGRYLKEAGFDLMSTANNHSGDFGDHCRRQTETTLDGLGIAWSGPPGSVASVEHDGWRVAMIGFHSSKTCNYINDHETAAALVQSAKRTHDLVIVSFHGGAEGSKATHVPDSMELFYGEKRGHLRRFAKAVVDAGADLVLGHGPHVPRGMELIDGHLVAYSLGNFATYGRFSLGGHLSTSLVLDLTLDHEGRFVGGQILPVKLVGKGVPMPDPTATAVDLIRTLSAEDFPTTGVVVAQDGTLGVR